MWRGEDARLSISPSASTAATLLGLTKMVCSGIQTVGPYPLPAMTMLPTMPRFSGNHWGIDFHSSAAYIFSFQTLTTFMMEVCRTVPHIAPNPVMHPREITHAQSAKAALSILRAKKVRAYPPLRKNYFIMANYIAMCYTCLGYLNIRPCL